MIRLATVSDAEQLERLNCEFNGVGETTLAYIRESLLHNRQEIVVVAEDNGLLVGFVCVQLKRSFCYEEYMPEITEVYVMPEHRSKGIGSEMITYAEICCRRMYPLHKFELLTGKENFTAQSVYSRLGYKDDGEMHLSKVTISPSLTEQ